MEPQIISGNTSTYTCLTCKVLFQNIEAQREHYKQEWHKYNLKRKVAGLPSITEDEFNEKIKKQIEDNELANQVNVWNCEVCKKVFNSENAFKNHEISKKHLENAANYEKNKTMDTDDSDDDLSDNNGDTKEPKINWKKRFAEAQTEEEFNKVLEEKIKVSRKLEETECLFCNFKGNTFEEKMEHMTVEHTFFIPDVEYLANLKGLLAYLGEKISIGNTCIYCERMFHSLEAVRKHMLDKGHTKISYEEGPDLEIANFYDFSVLDDEDEDMENGEDEVNNQALTITSEGTELILPSGAHIGHRDYKRYYNQNLRDRNDSNSKALMTLSEKYKALGYYEIGSSGMTIEKERLEKMKAARTELKKYARERGVMGQKANDFHIPWGRLGQFKNLFLM
jgi:pre-60S factor REI1